MEIKELKEKYDSLTDEEREFLILKYCLEEPKKEKILEIVMEIDDKFYKKYLKQLCAAIAHNVFEKEIQKTQNFFQQCEYHFDNILNNFKVLSQELKLENSLELSLLYTYLLWNGYFSKNNEFNYEMQNRALILGRFSYDIMNGNGVCLNFSEMLTHILNKCGYHSCILTNKAIDPKKIKNDYIPSINRQIKKPDALNKFLPLMLKPIVNKIGNHAFNLIEENGKLFIYDATNLIFLEVKNKDLANLLVGQGEFKLSTEYSYVLNSNKDYKTLDLLYEMKEFISPYSRKDYIVTSENSIELFDKNKQLLKDYHSQINNDILKISETVEDYKKNKKKILKNK